MVMVVFEVEHLCQAAKCHPKLKPRFKILVAILKATSLHGVYFPLRCIGRCDYLLRVSLQTRIYGRLCCWLSKVGLSTHPHHNTIVRSQEVGHPTDLTDGLSMRNNDICTGLRSCIRRPSTDFDLCSANQMLF
jgi:hypothetical protein